MSFIMTIRINNSRHSLFHVTKIILKETHNNIIKFILFNEISHIKNVTVVCTNIIYSVKNIYTVILLKGTINIHAIFQLKTIVSFNTIILRFQPLSGPPSENDIFRNVRQRDPRSDLGALEPSRV